MFLKIISLAFLLYILYKFVFGFIIPIFRATQKIKKGFRDIQQQANENMNRQQANSTNTSSAGEKRKEPIGDYIEFEEIENNTRR